MSNLVCQTEIIFYNQKGQGVGFYEQKPIYIAHTIKGEIVKCQIVEVKPKYFVGKLLEVVKPSNQRVDNLPKDYHKIGGYELIHMSQEAEKVFKVEKIINDFKQNAGFELPDFEFFNGKKQLRYRNKLTLHDGGFMIPSTNDLIYLDDFLLTYIKPFSDKKGKTIFRKLDTLIVGSPKDTLYTTDTLLGIKFRVGLDSFYQVNKEVTEVIYQDIQKFIPTNSFVLDLYSGIGTITLVAAQKAKKVIGVERNKKSFEDALFNIKENNFDNVEFYNQDVTKFLEKHKFQNKPDVVLVDPGREGLDNNLILKLLSLQPDLIIYLSCNPGTQAANFKKMKNDYDIIFSKAYNMFPKTYHVENLIVLKKKKVLNCLVNLI